MPSAPVPALPTIQSLGNSPPKDIDPVKIAGEWLGEFQAAISPSSGGVDIDKVLGLLQLVAVWRDILSLTWDFRTFIGTAQIKTFLQDRIANPSLYDKTRLNNFKLETASVEKPWEDVEWIEALFTFSVGTWGGGDGVLRLVFTSEGVWKAYTLYTNLQSLLEYPEKVGALRDPLPNHGRWADQRQKEIEFEGVEPYVVIVGGGQSGLGLGARLKFLDIPTLILEKNPRVGDQWRNRYQALCLHDPVCKSYSLNEHPLCNHHRLQGMTICLIFRTHTVLFEFAPKTNSFIDSLRVGQYGPPPKRCARQPQWTGLPSSSLLIVSRLARILRQSYGTQRLDLFNCHIRGKGCLRRVDRQLDPNTPRWNRNQTCSPPSPRCPCPGVRRRIVECSKISKAGHSPRFSSCSCTLD